MVRFNIFVVAVLIGSPALSQSFPSFTPDGTSFSIAFNGHDGSANAPRSENYTYQLLATSRYSLNDRFGVGFSIGYNEEVSNDSYYSNRTLLEVNPYYMVDGGEIGLFYTAISHDDGGQERASQFGIIGHQEFGPTTFEAYASTYKEAGNDDSNNVGIALGYSFNDSFFGYYAERYDFDGDDFEGLTSIGLSYQMNRTPVTLSVEYSRFSDQDVTAFDSEWEQVSFIARYSLDDGAQSMFRGVRSVDFFYD